MDYLDNEEAVDEEDGAAGSVWALLICLLALLTGCGVFWIGHSQSSWWIMAPLEVIGGAVAFVSGVVLLILSSVSELGLSEPKSKWLDFEPPNDPDGFP